MLRGHVAFGSHHELPQTCVYFTIVREPVSRVISVYNYICADRVHHLHKEVMQMGLSRFVMSGITGETNDAQVRQLCGIDGEFPQKPYGKMLHPYGFCTEDMFEQVLVNFKEHFVVVGLTERFDDTLQQLRERLSWRVGSYVRKNSVPPRAPVTDTDRDVIREYNQLDVKLYEYVKGKFDAPPSSWLRYA